MKLFITILISFLLLSCVSTYKYTDVNEFNSEEGYVALHLNKNLSVSLKNLDTNELININLKKKDGLIAFSLPVGDYAVTKLTYHHYSLLNSNTYYIHVPLYLKTIVNVENNSIIYLGSFSINKKLGQKRQFVYDYFYDEAFSQIETEYYYGANFALKPLEQLSLENIEESYFDFNM